MTGRRRLVRVPASSANLGPGFDVLAAALDIHLELEVTETGEFEVDAAGDGLPSGRDNLCVRAFERLHPADGLRFQIRSEIPVARGLGSSAAAIVAGLLAADHMYELGLDPPDVYRHAVVLEGHPDNVAAALFGGFAVSPPANDADAPARLEPPQGVEGVLAIPADEVATEAARAALPAEVPMEDAVANIAAASHLVLGIERSDLTLISHGLRDRLHQKRRAGVYPRSMELLSLSEDAGAIGATVSGAGPAVLFWCFWQDTGKVVDALTDRVGDDVEIRRARFTPLGADVPEL
jgi:homoserine kinase